MKPTSLNIVFWDWNANAMISDPDGLRTHINNAAYSIFGSMNLEVVTQFVGATTTGGTLIEPASNSVGTIRIINDNRGTRPHDAASCTAAGLPTNCCATPGLPPNGAVAQYWASYYNLGPNDIIGVVYPKDCGNTGLYCAVNGAVSTYTDHTEVFALPYQSPACAGTATEPDSVFAAMSHEIAELITDPKDPAASPVTTGWYQTSSPGVPNEIGDSWDSDPCNTTITPFGVPISSSQAYQRQAFHSNSANSGFRGCVFARGDHVAVFGEAGGNLWMNQTAIQNSGSSYSTNSSGWTFLGNGGVSLRAGKVASAAERDQSGLVHAFAFDTSTPPTLWHAMRSTPTGSFVWDSWGTSPCTSGYSFDPDAVSVAPGAVEVWVTCSTGSTIHRRKYQYPGTVYSWDHISVPYAASTGPGVASWGDGKRRDIFYGNFTIPSTLIHGWTSDGTTYSWQDLGLGGSSYGVASAPDVASWQQYRIDAVWKDGANHVAHWYWDDVVPPGYSGFNLWSGGAPSGVSLGGGSPPAIANLGDNRLTVIAGTSAGVLWYSPWLDGTQFSWDNSINGSGQTFGSDITSW